MDSPIWSRSNSRIHHQHHHQQSHPSTTPASGPPIALKPTTSRVSTESFDMPPSERVRNMSLLSRAESVMFKPANGESDSRPLLLLRASTVPRIPGLWRRMFKISSAKFLPEDIDSSARHAPGSPDYARFAAPQLPASPLAARVHRLILAAIDADLRVLECRFKKDAVRFPPVVYTFIGFQLLAMFLFIFGIGQSGWPIGLPLVLFIMACSLGFHILFSVLIRDMLTDLKAEHAVLVLSIRRVAARAPYHLSFSASTYVHKLSLSEWIVFTPLVALFSIWAIPLARRLFRIDEVPTQCRVLMSAPPPSLGGAIGFDHHELNTKSANADRFVILNGTVRPTVWNVVAELRVPPAGEAGASIEVGVESAVRKGPRVASDQTFVP
ncbi:hypothetical protein HDU84_002085 [Entophlyctis sp. JEL0112]|nr:hypothetical protein HDU84_002085 [Entophlyctis sp. JEL0112]